MPIYYGAETFRYVRWLGFLMTQEALIPDALWRQRFYEQ